MSRKLPSFSLGPEAEEAPIPGLGCVPDGRMTKVDSWLCNRYEPG